MTQSPALRVLVVEDEPLISEMLQMGLSYEGFAVTVVGDGLEAVAQARAEMPDLVVLDLLMSHPRQVFSREIILNRVWGYDYLGDTNVIDVYIRYLREKLGDDDRRLIRSVRGVGYSLEPPDGPA